MSGNPLRRLAEFGQSLWYDNIQRGLMISGAFQRLVDDDGVVGVTSNPTIFEKAIGGSVDYDAEFAALVKRGKTAEAILDTLMVHDIQMAADLLRPIYERTQGWDGYVSIEVGPHLAHDTAGTITEARRLWKLVKRPNILVKVPATSEGIPAVEELIADGINVNITLIFALARYAEVIHAYLTGLERRVRAKQPIRHIASVASFFVSRVDTAVDKPLEARLAATHDPQQQVMLRGLLGKAAIANAKLAYQTFKTAFSQPRFAALRQHGARVQRPLWASTSAKNPTYRDVLYLEELIGPETVNTVPPVALEAFRDHGCVRLTLTDDVDGAHRVLADLAKAGIDLTAVTTQLEREGVAAFAHSHDQLLATIRAKRAALRAGILQRQSAQLGREADHVRAALASLDKQAFARRLWAKDASLWKSDAAHQHIIKNRLGWLTVLATMRERLDQIQAFAAEIRQAGFTHVVLLGMGGSSLCPEVLSRTFGSAAGFPKLLMLDSTDPGMMRTIEQSVHLPTTLFVVSSKSGGTIEVVSFYRYFADRIRALHKERAFGQQFIAITDPGTSLEKLARQDGFRRMFLNPPDVGGRFSALSYFGLVPAALIGLDVDRLLSRAETMAQACSAGLQASHNPGVWLGGLLGALGKAGRDKITFVMDRRIHSFGWWVEQLIAECTGKEGKGLVPVEGEALTAPSAYGSDRVFVWLRVGAKANPAVARQLQALERAGHPVIQLVLKDAFDLGGELFRWEVAVSVIGAILGINPFDEPNVKESKDNTARLLQTFESTGRLSQGTLVLETAGIQLMADAQTARLLAAHHGTLSEALSVHVKRVRPGDYLALTAYLEPTPARERLLQALRLQWRSQGRIATTLGYGPRLLHSTGQLHKGGPGNGLFVQIIGGNAQDVAIPGVAYSFGVLKQAQALGDFQSLQSKQRRVVRLMLSDRVDEDLQTLTQACLPAPETRRVNAGLRRSRSRARVIK